LAASAGIVPGNVEICEAVVAGSDVSPDKAEGRVWSVFNDIELAAWLAPMSAPAPFLTNPAGLPDTTAIRDVRIKSMFSRLPIPQAAPASPTAVTTGTSIRVVASAGRYAYKPSFFVVNLHFATELD
jgi:hypothetical protein